MITPLFLLLPSLLGGFGLQVPAPGANTPAVALEAGERTAACSLTYSGATSRARQELAERAPDSSGEWVRRLESVARDGGGARAGAIEAYVESVLRDRSLALVMDAWASTTGSQERATAQVGLLHRVVWDVRRPVTLDVRGSVSQSPGGHVHVHLVGPSGPVFRLGSGQGVPGRITRRTVLAPGRYVLRAQLDLSAEGQRDQPTASRAGLELELGLD